MFVFIAPHSKCFINEKRNCDSNAYPAAISMFNIVKDKNHPAILFRPPKQTRQAVDQNRYEARNTNFRKELRALYKEHPDALFIECHSFPNDFKKGDVYLLDIEDPPSRISRRIGSSLYNHGMTNVKGGVLEGSFKNDIQYELKQHGINTVLIEFNEDLYESQLEKIASIIVNSLL